MATRKEMRHGSKGSVVICLHGEKLENFFNLETGEKGNLLHLPQNTLGLDFRKSLQYSGKMIGDDLNLARVIPQPTDKSNQPNQSGDNQTRRYGRQLVRESQPIEGTLGTS